MKKRYGCYLAVLAAVTLAAGGCAGQGAAAQTALDTTAAQETTAEETTADDATVVESVTGAIESSGASEEAAAQLVRIYGPVTKLEGGDLSIDNQASVSSAGEIILHVDPEASYILDAVSGLPLTAEEIEDGSTIYAYIGPAMTMSLPPQTNAELIFANVPADYKVPDYVEVKSVVTDADSSETVLTTADGTEYTLAEDCEIVPYLTRNIVTLDDLTQGRRCVVWSGDDNTAVRIMVFAQ